MSKTKFLIIIIVMIIASIITTNAFCLDFNYEMVRDFHIGGWYLQYGVFCENSIIDSTYMYYVNSYGLEIINIDENTGNLERVHVEGFNGLTYNLVKKDNYIYLLSLIELSLRKKDTFLYKIDITTPGNPVVIDSVIFNCDYNISSLNLFNNNLVYDKYDYYNSIKKLVFFNEYLEEINSVQIFSSAFPINDTLFATFDGQSFDTFNIYNISDINNIYLQNNIDLSNSPSPIHEGCIQQIDSTTIVRCSNGGLVFWDISDISNWQFISDYPTGSPVDRITKKNHYIIAPQGCELIETIDISDINNPLQHSSYYYTDEQIYFSNIHYANPIMKIHNNHGYLGTSQGGIYQYEISDGNLTYINDFITEHNPRAYSSTDKLIFSDHLFVSTYNNGVYIYDISNVSEPVLVTTILDSCRIWGVKNLGSLLCVCFVNRQIEIKMYIFDISDPGNPIFSAEINNLESIPVLKKNINEPNCIYLDYWWNVPTDKIVKYDLSEPTNPVLIFEYPLPCDIYGQCLFHNGYFYALEYTYSNHDLYIFSGFEENEPALEQTLYNFSPYESYLTTINTIGDYFHLDPELWGENDTEKFYEFITPFQLEEKFSIEDDAGSHGIINNDILFKPYFDGIALFNLTNNPTGYIESFKFIYSYSSNPEIYFLNQNNIQYFVSIQRECISIYQYNIEHSIDDNSINNSSFSNFPNPFSNSTTISFSGTANSHELKRIKIYNVKGQLVRELHPIAPSHSLHVSVIWDGRDESGKEVKNGVYFCTLQSEKELYVQKVVLMR